MTFRLPDAHRLQSRPFAPLDRVQYMSGNNEIVIGRVVSVSADGQVVDIRALSVGGKQLITQPSHTFRADQIEHV